MLWTESRFCSYFGPFKNWRKIPGTGTSTSNNSRTTNLRTSDFASAITVCSSIEMTIQKRFSCCGYSIGRSCIKLFVKRLLDKRIQFFDNAFIFQNRVCQKREENTEICKALSTQRVEGNFCSNLRFLRGLPESVAAIGAQCINR